MKASRGKKHDYLGMTLDYTEKGKVKIDMTDYAEKMVAKFPQEDLQGSKVPNCVSKNLFSVDKRSPRLDDEKSEMLHSVVLKGLFMAKHGRPDLLQLIMYLCMRTKEPTRLDWNKLVHIMKFLKQTKDDCLMLQSNGAHILIWSVNSSFAVHNDYHSHTGGMMMMGKGSIINISSKQKVNTRSSTEAEVIGVDDCIGPILWTHQFLEHQGYDVKDNVLLQDNQSTIQLEENGRASAGKRSRHMNIWYFFVMDQVIKGLISIRYCPTDEMDSDYHTKPLQGKKFHQFWCHIMGLPYKES